MEKNSIPNCVGIIMDGNRRYSKARGGVPWEGHEAGYKKTKEVLRWLRDAGVKYVIAYTFSTENWNRSEIEVSFLLKLIERVLTHELDWAHEDGIRIKVIGDRSRFSPSMQQLLLNAETATANNNRITLGVALNYGGRAEILQAVNEAVKIGQPVSEENFSKLLYTKDFPDPDIIIRTSGEQRLSNFLPWQSVYSELFFVKKLFPELNKEDIDAVLAEYTERDRRRGK